MTKKIVKPINPLIYKTAGEFAAVFFEAGRSSGMTSKFKTHKGYVNKYIERFIPIAVKTLIEMLKPTSNCSEFMRMEVYEALMDPVNDPELMEGKVNGIPDYNAEMIAKAMNAFDKNQLKFNSIQPNKTYRNKLLNTANPFTPKAN